MKKNVLIIFILLSLLWEVAPAFSDAPVSIDQWEFSYWIIQESSLEVSYVKTSDTSYFRFMYSQDPIKLTSDEVKSLVEVLSQSDAVFTSLASQPDSSKDYVISDEVKLSFSYSKKDGRQINLIDTTSSYLLYFCPIPTKYLKQLIPVLGKAEEIENYFSSILKF